jgi:hypothetical protein
LKEHVAFFLKQSLEEKYHPLHKTEAWIVDTEQKIHKGKLSVEPWLYKKVLQKLQISTQNLGDSGYLDASHLEELILEKHKES